MMAVLTGLTGVLKKMRMRAGGTFIVEPSTGLDPTTKDEASAICGRNSPGSKLNNNNKQKLADAMKTGLRKCPFRIKSFVAERVRTPCEIVHQSPSASNMMIFSLTLFYQLQSQHRRQLRQLRHQRQMLVPSLPTSSI